MKLRGHGSAVAIVLSVLAVVVAGGGTAVAVSSSVNIADPTTPSRVAKVDAGGRLAVSGAQSTIDSTGYLTGFLNQSTTLVISPTTATIAISRIQLSDPTANTSASEQQLSLYRYAVDGTGTCDTTSTPALIARYDLAAGDDLDDALPSPIVLAPTGGAKYCLEFAVDYLSTSAATQPQFYLGYGIAAYVTSGTYTGIGAPGAAPVRPNLSAEIGG